MFGGAENAEVEISAVHGNCRGMVENTGVEFAGARACV